MKKTEWYPVSIAPVRNGVYEVRCCVGSVWGRCTKLRRVDNEWKDAYGLSANVQHCDEWRGLTEPQE